MDTGDTVRVRLRMMRMTRTRRTASSLSGLASWGTMAGRAHPVVWEEVVTSIGDWVRPVPGKIWRLVSKPETRLLPGKTESSQVRIATEH